MKKKSKMQYILIIVVIPFFISTSAVSQQKYNNKIAADTMEPDILWWYNLDAPSFGSAASEDIDDDGKLEIVFGTYFNDEHVYALNADDGSLLWSYNTGGCNDASPAIADVDLDGDLEVIIPASSPYKVYCLNGKTGAVEWSTSTGYPNCIDSPPAIADVDQDNKPEIILGTFYGYVFCLNGEDGGIAWQKNLGSTSYIQSGPNILDCDNDGQLDVVVAQFSGDCRVYALQGNNGSLLWYSNIPQDYMYHGGSFADIDEDGKPEIVIGCYDNDVYVFNAEDGSLCWSYTAAQYIAAPTSIADVNNDDHLEIVFASHNMLGVLSNTGSLLWSHSTGGSIFRGASLFDVNNDGIVDVCFGSSDGTLRVLRGSDGQVIWTYNLQAHYGNTFDIDHAPILADFNDDGKVDVFIVGGYGTSSNPSLNHGRAYALTAGTGTGPGWMMFRHDLVHSGCYNPSSSPLEPPTITGPRWGKTEVEYTFYVHIPVNANNDDVFVTINWDDGNFSDWLGPYTCGQTITVAHSWSTTGDYSLQAKLKTVFAEESIWSEPFLFTVEDEPPELTLLQPLDNTLYLFNNINHSFITTVIFGNIMVMATASDALSGLDHVAFYVDDILQYNRSTQPYSWWWETPMFFRHTLSIKAFDNAGNSVDTTIGVWKFF